MFYTYILKEGKMGFPPDFKSLIEQKQTELDDLKERFRSLCEHPDIKHHGYNNDGG